jgi:hypothetical protein
MEWLGDFQEGALYRDDPRSTSTTFSITAGKN